MEWRQVLKCPPPPENGGCVTFQETFQFELLCRAGEKRRYTITIWVRKVDEYVSFFLSGGYIKAFLPLSLGMVVLKYSPVRPRHTRSSPRSALFLWKTRFDGPPAGMNGCLRRAEGQGYGCVHALLILMYV